MGRRGGKEVAECWRVDPHGEYALAERKRLAETNKRRTAGGKSTAFKLRFSLLMRLAKQGVSGHYRCDGRIWRIWSHG